MMIGVALRQRQRPLGHDPGQCLGHGRGRSASPRPIRARATGITTARLGGQAMTRNWPQPAPMRFALPSRPAPLLLSHSGQPGPWATVSVRAAVPLLAPAFAGYRISRAGLLHPAQARPTSSAAATCCKIRITVERAGRAQLGGGRGSDSRPAPRSSAAAAANRRCSPRRRAAARARAGLCRARLRCLARLFRLAAARARPRRICRAGQRRRPLPAAADAGRGDVFAGDPRRAAKPAARRRRHDRVTRWAWLRRRPARLAARAAVDPDRLQPVRPMPPSMPRYAKVRADWRSSEAWLRDRNGRLLDTIRVDYSPCAGSDWVPLDQIAPALRDDGRRRRGQALREPWRRRLARARRLGLGGTARPRGARREHLDDAACRLPRARARRPGRARPARQDPPDARRLGDRGALDARTRSSKPISTSPASAARPRASVRRRARCSARRPMRSGDDRCAAARRLAAGAAGRCQHGRAARLPDRPSRRLQPMIAEAEAMTGPARRLADDPNLAPHLAVRLLRTPGDDDHDHARRARPGDRDHGAAPPAARRSAATARATARWWWSTMRTGDVLAYVGGIGGASTAAAVDNADAPIARRDRRSKPFLYGQAIERGYLTAGLDPRRQPGPARHRLRPLRAQGL